MKSLKTDTQNKAAEALNTGNGKTSTVKPSLPIRHKASAGALPSTHRDMEKKQRALFVQTPAGPVAFRLPTGKTSCIVDSNSTTQVLKVVTPTAVFEYVNAPFACMPLFDIDQPTALNVRALHFGCRIFFGLHPKSAKAQKLFEFLVKVPTHDGLFWADSSRLELWVQAQQCAFDTSVGLGTQIRIAA